MNKWFGLPWLGNDLFSKLKRAGIAYDPKFGFKFTRETDVSRAIGIISGALGEDVEVESSCFICGRPLGENERAGSVLCSECTKSGDAYELYTMKFANLMAEI
jgi:hypothetical protein